MIWCSVGSWEVLSLQTITITSDGLSDMSNAHWQGNVFKFSFRVMVSHFYGLQPSLSDVSSDISRDVLATGDQMITHRYLVKWRISLRFKIAKHLDNVRTQVKKIYYKGLVTVRHLNEEMLRIISLYWHTDTSNCVADWDICQYRGRFSEYCICREAASISFT